MPIIDGIYYFAHENGEDRSQPTIVLIHGAGGNHLHWPSAVRRMPGTRVFTLDLPGHGKSEGLGEQSISAYVEHIMRWASAIDLPKAIFMGHSMGGAIVQQLALAHPQRVRAIGLMGTGARLSVNEDLLGMVSRKETFPSAVDLIVKWSCKKDVDARLAEQIKKAMLETRPAVLHGDFMACNEFNFTEQLPKIKQPALVICGADDKMTPPRLSEKLAETLPNAQLHIVPDSGHMVLLEQAETVAPLIEAFVKKVSP